MLLCLRNRMMIPVFEIDALLPVTLQAVSDLMMERAMKCKHLSYGFICGACSMQCAQIVCIAKCNIAQMLTNTLLAECIWMRDSVIGQIDTHINGNVSRIRIYGRNS